MDYLEIEAHAQKLSPQDRIRLAESLLHSLRPKKRRPVEKTSVPNLTERSKQEFLQEKLTLPGDSSLARVLGVLRTENQPAPTDQETESMITDYLTEKYL